MSAMQGVYRKPGNIFCRAHAVSRAFGPVVLGGEGPSTQWCQNTKFYKISNLPTNRITGHTEGNKFVILINWPLKFIQFFLLAQ